MSEATGAKETFLAETADFYSMCQRVLAVLKPQIVPFDVPEKMQQHIDAVAEKLAAHSEKLAAMYRQCYIHALKTTIIPTENDTYFVMGGDIPGMWLRDSSAEIWPYAKFADIPEIGAIIRGTLRRQFANIRIDPYANAFNHEPNSFGMVEDLPRNDPWVWERKYETDSLSYVIRLMYRYWKTTDDASLLETEFPETMKTILKIWTDEQDHWNKSTYRFFRKTDRDNDSLTPDGMGRPVGYTGMTWSGFRASDDACTYGYNIPENMLAVTALNFAEEMLAGSDLIPQIQKLRTEIKEGIRKFGIVEHEKYGKIYAYETDGLGHYELMDDANTPNLLSMPYLGFKDEGSDEIYQNTRRFILSSDNPYYYEGKYAKGLGSAHEHTGFVWNMGLSMQGMTSQDKEEMLRVIDTLTACDGDTGYMHECFDADDPARYRRAFFPWSDNLFCEFAERCAEELF